MKTGHAFTVLVASLLVLHGVAQAQEKRSGQEAPAFKHDPFARPYKDKTASPTGMAAAPSSAPALPPSVAAETLPPLRAVLFDRYKPLVSIGGSVIGIGDIVNGYQLVKVEERAALFEKKGVRLRLLLDKEPLP